MELQDPQTNTLATILDEDIAKQEDLKRMKLIATSLLVISFIIFVISTIYVDSGVWVGFVQATAEAAMVGAIADWFAVTALFRYPLGIKIPHTAIIPNRKDRLGKQLGRFVKTNFLSEAIITEKLRSINMTESLATWLTRPEKSAAVADQLAVGLGTIVQVIKDEDVQALIEKAVVSRLETMRIAPLLGNALSIVTSGERKHEMLRGTVKLGSRILHDNQDAIITKIQHEIPWWLPRGVDVAIYEKLVVSLDETLQAVDEDPNHPLYEHFDNLIQRFAHDLQNSPTVEAKEATLKDEILQDSLIKDFSASLWQDIKAALLERSEDPDLDIRPSLQQALMGFGESLLEDATLREKVNYWIEDAVAYLISQYGHEVELLISQTIERWDAEATSQKIELQVGRDLQFIRINGTLVGGLVGFIIHGISLLI
ncbi:MAG: DUF445 domain-containing protein [Chloroflexota bacterium]